MRIKWYAFMIDKSNWLAVNITITNLEIFLCFSSQWQLLQNACALIWYVVVPMRIFLKFPDLQYLNSMV